VANIPIKEQIVESLISLLIDSIGWIEREEVLPDADLTLDLHIDGNDLSIFAMEIEKHFGIKSTFDEWLDVGSINETADLVLRNLAIQELHRC
jgi:acyl carrier protein